MDADIRTASVYLQTEAWTLYGIGIISIILRIWGRIRRCGWSGFQLDDFFIAMAATFYTLFIYGTLAMNAAYTVSNSSSVGLVDLVTADPAKYIEGSKWGMVAEQCMLNTLYLIKGSILVFYGRLVVGQRAEFIVKFAMGYVVCCWIGSQMAFFFLTCNPFASNWAVPVPSMECVLWDHYAICQDVLNISSDFLIISIPIPMFIRANYPTRQKILLCSVFGLGIFVITCAIINKVEMNTGAWQNWNCREASVAIYVANVPAILSIVRTFQKHKYLINTYSTGGLSATGTRRTRYSMENKRLNFRPPCPELAEWIL